MFSCLFRKSWGLRTVNYVTKGNCEPLPREEWESLSTSTLQSVYNDALINDISWQTFQSLPRPPLEALRNIEIAEIDLNESFFLKQNSFVYFCGYMYSKFLKLHNCMSPIPRLEDETDSRLFFKWKKNITTAVW